MQWPKGVRFYGWQLSPYIMHHYPEGSLMTIFLWSYFKSIVCCHDGRRCCVFSSWWVLEIPPWSLGPLWTLPACNWSRSYCSASGRHASPCTCDWEKEKGMRALIECSNECHIETGKSLGRVHPLWSCMCHWSFHTRLLTQGMECMLRHVHSSFSCH